MKPQGFRVKIKKHKKHLKPPPNESWNSRLWTNFRQVFFFPTKAQASKPETWTRDAKSQNWDYEEASVLGLVGRLMCLQPETFIKSYNGRFNWMINQIFTCKIGLGNDHFHPFKTGSLRFQVTLILKNHANKTSKKRIFAATIMFKKETRIKNGRAPSFLSSHPVQAAHRTKEPSEGQKDFVERKSLNPACCWDRLLVWLLVSSLSWSFWKNYLRTIRSRESSLNSRESLFKSV